jgi:2-methylisocitrate lyase-like PEP mutase family enzyme
MPNALFATQFRSRHAQAKPLVLPNVWDAASAALMQSLGAEAIATTSAGLAWACGYPDGNQLPIDVHVAAVRRIVRVIRLPLTVDVEGGYSDDPGVVAAHVEQIVNEGAVGINLEDGDDDPSLLCRKIEAIKAAARRSGVDLFVNARTDVCLKNLAPGREVAEVLQRAASYRSAGADGLFVPLLSDLQAIEAVVQGQPLPVNVMACPGLPGVEVLQKLGVRRLSAGSSIAQSAWAAARAIAARFLAQGSSEAHFQSSASFTDVDSTLRVQ